VKPRRRPLADFTATPRLIPISLIAVAIGVLSGLVAKLLLDLIGLFTNLFFFQRWSSELASPADHQLGWLVVLVPVAGALIIGLMARYGSERIRGHGIPEALESILIRGSRVEPRLAVLKPLSAAISIGSGGPFGAEGPIIMTGGAFGSLIAQGFHLTNAERKTLLVAGATGGMAATFAAPISAVLLGIELLLFEWKPRSFIPVALASAAAVATRNIVIGPGPLFPAPEHAAVVGVEALLGCVAVGLGVGVLALLTTASVYRFEDLFKRLPVHWMWWPAIGGVVIGIGGLIYPHALGVGYDSIAGLLDDRFTVTQVLVLIAVKWTIWSFALGSGTSGGVLAPLLMLGGALGALEAQVLPDQGAGFWAMISMGAIMAGVMRSPLTGIVFAAEITHDFDAMVPLAVACAVAYAVSVLILPRSILTEKVARRGYHITREYAIDPLEVLFVREVMRTGAAAPQPGQPLADADETLRTVAARMAETGCTEMAVVDADGAHVGTVALEELLEARARHQEEETRMERVIPVGRMLPPFLRRRA
jgi:H+/Cl- antiporter ClcA